MRSSPFAARFRGEMLEICAQNGVCGVVLSDFSAFLRRKLRDLSEVSLDSLPALDLRRRLALLECPESPDQVLPPANQRSARFRIRHAVHLLTPSASSTGPNTPTCSSQRPSLAAGLSRKRERSRMYFRRVFRDLWRVWRMMDTSAAPLRNACVTNPARRLWPAY